MKQNKYNIQRRKEERLNKVNNFIVGPLCYPLKIPKVLFNLVVREIKVYMNRRENKQYGLRNPVYNHLEIPDCCFNKKSSNMVRVL